MSDANGISLKEFIERVLDEREKHTQTKFDNAQRALEVNKIELDKKLFELNNLRKEYTEDRLIDQRQYVKQESFDIKTDIYDKWISSADKKFAIIDTRSRTWNTAIVLFFIIIQIIFKFFIK